MSLTFRWNKHLLVFAGSLFVASLIFFSGPLQAEEAAGNAYENLLDSLLRMEPLAEQAYTVSDFHLDKDVGSFVLRKGQLYFCTPIRGTTRAAIFVGSGHFSFSPPNNIELGQLRRFYNTDTLRQKFNVLFMLFTDSTAEQISAQCMPVDKKPSRRARERVQYALRYLSDQDKGYFETSFVNIILNEMNAGYFYSHFSSHDTQPLFWTINPLTYEGVSFARRIKGPSFLYRPEIICQFSSQLHLGQSETTVSAETVMIDSYRVQADLKGSDLAFAAETKMDMTILQSNLRWVHFYLFEDLEIDSMFWDDGSPATYAKGKENFVFG